ncbi:MAG: hypothetical protein KKF80_01790, partial [Candidatus Omnitrophica bacterium]|nr:hypothetical protein [Candidatus Omnitrophota bacterium]
FKENDFIARTLDNTIGKIIKVDPNLESIIGISASQAEKHGKVGAAFLKYDDMLLINYPAQIKQILDMIIAWSDSEPILTITAP